MSLDKMLEMQKQLDDRIIAEKGIVWTEEERFRNTLVALDVELSEFANEGRWFKVWSDDQEPRLEVECHACKGLGEFHHQVFSGNEHVDDRVDICTYCSGTGIQKRPLLEEFVDVVHFFLSLANQKGWSELLYFAEEALEDFRENAFDGGLNMVYLELKNRLGVLGVEHDEKKYVPFLDWSKHQFNFRTAWYIFISIGLVEYDFTFKQIEEAYFVKNKTNHERQDNGY
ncbi:dUTP diphosphatase [Sutcliffiella halmapala]|uniref:dUTP diphosphatase n=1 Tax=Sutcliffiella halmapala TaxID=79882 RepID=UPI0009957FC4|nr:dUTP diphosphatase [Sutcliffiella halmapala]